ncbi:MAG: aspartate--tRNA(Asn) ligase, partial [Clostridia bacterium]|nr:aspartate--tRNA(Asn) ligase [Clostridia bacterium]
CMAFDLLYRGWEMNSGAVREHRYEQLKSQIEEHGVDSEKMKDYLEFFKYGCPPHGGIGFGIERFMAKLLGLASLKETVFIFRGPSRIKP